MANSKKATAQNKVDSKKVTSATKPIKLGGRFSVPTKGNKVSESQPIKLGGSFSVPTKGN